MSRATVAGPYDVSLVEGSITTPADAERIREVRANSRRLITIGACATAGGIQGLRNFAASGEYAATVYAHPEYIASLDTSTPIADHVEVDFELHGCPIDRRQLLEVITATLAGRRPVIPGTRCARSARAAAPSACSCARGTPCLGPVTRTGCGALCPADRTGLLRLLRARPTPPTPPRSPPQLRRQGMAPVDVSRLFAHLQRRRPCLPRRVRGPRRPDPGGPRAPVHRGTTEERS